MDRIDKLLEENDILKELEESSKTLQVISDELAEELLDSSEDEIKWGSRWE